MNLRNIGEFVSLNQGLAINKASEHLISNEKQGKFILPLLRIADMLGNNFSKFISTEVNKNVIANEDDIIYTRTGQIGLAFRGFKGVVHNNSFIVTLTSDEIDKDYLFVVLQSQFFRNQALTMAKNSVQPDLTHSMFNSIKIPVPTKHEQKSIAQIYLSLSNKIETNNQINFELESMAKTLYDYWFLQFEFPNAEGKPYKSSGGKMVYNEQLKREIPEGWEVKEILELVDWVSNSQPPKSQFCYEPKDGYIRFIQNRDYDSDSYKTYIPYKKSLSVVNRFDILMDKYGDAGVIRYGIEGVFNVALGKIQVKDEKYLEYIRSFLGSSNIYNYLHNSCMASTRASLSEENLRFLYLAIPNKDLLEKYEKMIHNIRESILKNKDENRELTSLRDFLLPLLMNGQVTIGDNDEK